ncbi:unnamed protein product [Bursaphelenchus xylophilus]|uniref:(pine wood nematode) hypothetical protein n=1 Tax=Bursaphelenchus xylophilus TaxID=6326 RepID=A0A1I7SQP6_BURXY|nr:unnamed protein product [Bursaphelenchus xylophilus]CAG9110201.1 unnamed protein product [Bursaphelenchus xylophilus]
MVVEKNHNQPEGYSLVSNSANTMETLEGNKKFRNVEGMGWLVTCLFIVGETAGAGLIAIPTAVVSTGLLGGILIITLGAAACAYTGYLLSENWTILQTRWPEYRNHCRKPYPAMGLRAIGPWFSTIVSCCLNITMFGTAVVFLLLAAKNLESFMHAYGGIHIGFCYLVVIVAIFMLPLTLFKSPKDFWWAVIVAMITTFIAAAMIMYGAYKDFDACIRHVDYPPISTSKFFMCFGTVMFAYGGHGAFPTIQHDMKRPYHFKRSVYLAFLIIFLMYVPVSIFAYITYGGSLRDSVIPSIQGFYLQQGVNILITLHVMMALTIMFNPLNQEWEELLNVSQEMGIGRVLARSAMMAFVVLVAETVPNFGVLLDLVGGSTITLMALVFPVVFNLFLSTGKAKHGGYIAAQEEDPPSLAEVWKYTPSSKKLIFSLILVFAVCGGTAGTVSAMNAMFNSEFSAPCYAGIFSKQLDAPVLEEQLHNNWTVLAHGKFNCCGVGKNISRFGHPEVFCLDPNSQVSHGSHG